MVSAQEVISYIYNNLRAGYSITQLEQELINEGMSKEQVEQYIQYVMDTYYEHDKGVVQNAKHHSPDIKWFIGIVGVLIIFILGSIILFSGEEVPEVVNPAVEYDPGPSNIPGSNSNGDTTTNNTESEGVDTTVSTNITVNTTVLNGTAEINLTENKTTGNTTYQNTSSTNTIKNNTSNDSAFEIDEEQPSIIISGEFETYERFSGADVFNIDESKTINYNNDSYVVTLKGLNSDSKSYILDIDGVEKTFRYGLYQTEKNLPVFAYDFVVNEPYAYVRLKHPQEAEIHLISDKENTYRFENKDYVFKIVDEYELDNTITLEVGSSGRVLGMGNKVIIEELYVSLDSLEFDDLAQAYAILTLSNISSLNGTITLNFNKTKETTILKPYGMNFEVHVIDINNSDVKFSVKDAGNFVVNDEDLFNISSFIVKELNYTIDSVTPTIGENWTLEVELAYS